MDLTRVGIYGGSAGGQNALGALLFHGDFYKAAAADCGCHDNRMDKIWWNEAWMGWPIGPHYAEQSNVTNAHKLTGALLLTVGELDHNVDPASTMQVVDALIKANKDFELVVFPGADHGAGGGPYGERRSARLLRPPPAQGRAARPERGRPGPKGTIDGTDSTTALAARPWLAAPAPCSRRWLPRRARAQAGDVPADARARLGRPRRLDRARCARRSSGTPPTGGA